MSGKGNIGKEHQKTGQRYPRASTPTSINGWVVLSNPDWSDRRLKSGVVPGTKARLRITCEQDVLPLFLNLAAEYHKFFRLRTIEGYDAKMASESPNSYSDHYSGTAIDINAPYEGWKGMNNYAWWKAPHRQAFARGLLNRYQVLNWGGSVDFGGSYTNGPSVDWMHWYLKPGTTRAQVKSRIAALGIMSTGQIRGQRPYAML